MSEVCNNMPVVNDSEEAQTAEKCSAEKVESTENAAENCANAQEGSASLESKKENEDLPLPNKNDVPGKCANKETFEKDTIYLYQFARTPVLPSLSPFCLKVETWLRLAELKYQNVEHKMRIRSKKGQLPFIELNDEEIVDSTLIVKKLSEKFNKDLDAGLTLEQRNISYAMITMLENHLVWIILYWRAKYPNYVLKGYQVNLRQSFGLPIPNSLLNFFFKITFGRKGNKKLKAHGLDIHSLEEIEEFGKNDLRVLSETLDCKPFFFGDEPTTLDVVAFSVLAQLHFLSKDVPYKLRDFMTEKCPNLVGHVSRMKEKCFSDWDQICTKLELNTHIQKTGSENKEGKEEDLEKQKEQENEANCEKEMEKDKTSNVGASEENKDKDEIN